MEAQAAAKRSAETEAPPAKRTAGLASIRASREDFLKARGLEGTAVVDGPSMDVSTGA